MELVAQCRLEGTFQGLELFGVHRMVNGLVWQQMDSRQMKLRAEQPVARVFRDGKTCWMEIAGVPGRVGVTPAPSEYRESPGACRRCADCTLRAAEGDAPTAAPAA